ncbi:MAG: acyl carrier protein [Gammaproteobacteria bacterium]|nr:MAG: acyl carrier protein [Gammaproteobacteria bacterium]
MTQDQIFEVIKKSVLDILIDIEPELIKIDKSLKDLGANSIDRIEVISSTLEQLNLKLPLMTFKNATNIREIVDIFHEHLCK